LEILKPQEKRTVKQRQSSCTHNFISFLKSELIYLMKTRTRSTFTPIIQNFKKKNQVLRKPKPQT
ncbi:MAG: hypothetical protein ACRBCT_09975, partial [Alphaproteobacteria bacterium]